MIWLADWWRDLRHALRTLVRTPAYTTAAAATLALAIGANVAMFGVLEIVLLRPLPYHAPDRLVMVWSEDPSQKLREGRSALWDVEQWRTQSRSFAELATFDTVATILTGADGAEQIVGASISANLLPLLGIQPLLGRSFSADEANQRQPLVMISHTFWRARFGASPDALGATLVLDGVSNRIIGVLPADFQVARLDADVWQAHPDSQAVRGVETWFAIGRLRPAVTVEQAQTEMSAIAHRLNEQRPAADRNRGLSVVPLSLYLVSPQSRLALWMLGGAVLCVFLIATANVTSLSLAGSVARTREMAVRVALGASAGRIVRQLVTEGILLAGLSGAIGTFLADIGIRLLRAFGPSSLPHLDAIRLDARVLLCAVAVSILAGILVGLPPAIATLRRSLQPTGEEKSRGMSGSVATRRIRRALVVVEFALAIVLLVGAGLLLRSWWNVSTINPGFNPDRVLVMQVDASASTTSNDAAQRTDLYRRMLEQIQTVPGVEHAGMIGDLFIQNSREQVVTMERSDGMVTERLRFASDEVSDDFFNAIGTPLRQGRFFSTGDRPDGLPVAIINESMARRSWPGQDPIGRRFKPGPQDSTRPWYTVVGVVADMHRQGLERDAFPQMFVSIAQSSAPRNVDLLIRTASRNPLTMASALRAAVRRVDKNAPIYGVAPLEQELGTYLAQRRFQTSLLIAFSLVALLMAAVGIYGLIHYSIATRTQEIGLRIAIGAQTSDIFRMVITEGLTLTLTGLALGLAAAWSLSRTVSSLLFGVTASDPLTFTIVSLLLTIVALTACFFPARRAMTVDPIVALRLT